MKKIARFAVDNPVTILMIILGILLLGIISYGRLGTDLFPDLNNPRIYVELTAGERPPEEMEKQFVDQIESIAMRQKDAINVSSVSMVGTARVIVEYAWDKDMDEAFLDLQKDISSFSQNADLDEFNISQYDPNAAPVMLVGLRHSLIDDMDELRQTAENYIRNELIRLEGIADIQLSGQEVNEVVIETNNYMLEAFGISANDIAGQIANYNRNVSGGSIEELGLKYIVKGVSIFNNAKELGDLIVGFKENNTTNTNPNQGPITGSTKTPVFLKDIAKVYTANKEPENIVTINGERCIGLSIYKEPRYNTVKAVEELKEAMLDLQKALPGYEFITIQDQGRYIEGSINEVMNTALIGILLAVFVLFIFLRRLGTTLIVSLAMPVSIIATFNLMYFNHLTVNIMTLGGLALGAGMMVDNAIVVLENIFRNREAGMKLRDAIIDGTSQVGGAITASTITTIVVFLPIVYMHGASGEMFKDQAWTVAFSLLSSLFVAILVIPLMVSRFFKDKPVEKTEDRSLKILWYTTILARIMDKKRLVIIAAIIIIAATAFIIPYVGSEFMPSAQTSGFTIEVKLPEGTRLETTAKTTAAIEMQLRDLLGERIITLYSHIGAKTTSGGDASDLFRDENTSLVKVITDEDFAPMTSQAIALIDSKISKIPGIEVSYSRDESAFTSIIGTEEAPLVVEIRGEDLDKIEALTSEVQTILGQNKKLTALRSSIEEGAPEVDIAIDRFRAGYFGIGIENIISQVKSTLEGSDAGEFEDGGEIKDISIKLEKVSVASLKNLVINTGNQDVPLSELATITVSSSPLEIRRNNQVRTAYIYANVDNSTPFDMLVEEVEQELSGLNLPPDYSATVTGDELKRKESMSNLTFALILSIILVYMVLASQFESLLHPFIIILTIPLAAVGSVWIFYLLGMPLNMMAYIGIIMLVGIAVNDSIILIDRINQLKDEGYSRYDAIIMAGGQRIRPILMTSITTILALLPLTFGFGESAALRSPMALAVIGGLVSSTILTLVVIPCVYWAIDSLKKSSKPE